MPFEVKALVPSGTDPPAEHPAFDASSEPKLTFFDSREGCLPTEGVAAALTRKGLRPLWLRLGPNDGDPGTLLVSLAAAAAHFEVPAQGAQRPPGQRLPGGYPRTSVEGRAWTSTAQSPPASGVPHPGHQAAHAPPAREAPRAAPATVAQATLDLMRKRPGPVYGWPPLFAQLGAALAGRLARKGALVLENVEHTWEQSSVFSVLVTEVLPALSGVAPCVLIASGNPPHGLPGECVWRSCEDIRVPSSAVRRILDDCAPALGHRSRERIAELAAVSPAVLAGLYAARRIAAPGDLMSVLQRARGEEELLTRLAGVLLAGAGDDARRALGLAVRTEYACPGMTAAVIGESQLPQGPWLQTLEDGWSLVRTCWRRPLRAVLGHRATPSRGTLRGAADWLLQAGAVEQAISLHLELGDHECAARAIASRAETLIGLGRWQTLGRWLAQLPPGTLAAQPNLSDTAAAVRAAGYLAMRVEDLRRRQRSHREAEAALRREERQALGELLACVAAPGRREDGGPGPDGWSAASPPLTMPGLGEHANPRAARRSWSWTRMRALLPGGRSGHVRPDGVNGASWPSHLSQPPAAPAIQYAAAAVPSTSLRTRHPPAAAPTPQGHASLGRNPVGHTAAPDRGSRAQHAQTEIAVHLLGPLCVTVDNVPVEDWSSGRTRSLFAYLLTHRQPWPSRDVLMEVFWPGSPSAMSRNRLNVAMHALRRVLRSATDLPVIEHASGAYRLHSGLRLWLDVDEFDSHVERGRRLEAADGFGKALEAYEFADGLYRGDFLAEDLYEDWAAAIRERLRLAHLDMLGRLGGIYFASGRYAACASVCRRIIERDPCREDAHRLLMRCYSRQGQSHLALIQYRACTRSLAGELGVGPAPATVELRDRIRRHEQI